MPRRGQCGRRRMGRVFELPNETREEQHDREQREFEDFLRGSTLARATAARRALYAAGADYDAIAKAVHRGLQKDDAAWARVWLDMAGLRDVEGLEAYTLLVAEQIGAIYLPFIPAEVRPQLLAKLRGLFGNGGPREIPAQVLEPAAP